ncbi:MAG: DUF2383 domain-containing protein [Ignavibacteriales bacterium]|nr:DUF2383 domain-containing protein [Ignavibacteriales bacterium]
MSAVPSFTSSTDLIEWLMQEEREAVKSYHAKATRIKDPRLQSLLTRLAEMRARSIAELESEVSEIRSQAEITTQINAMFW